MWLVFPSLYSLLFNACAVCGQTGSDCGQTGSDWCEEDGWVDRCGGGAVVHTQVLFERGKQSQRAYKSAGRARARWCRVNRTTDDDEHVALHHEPLWGGGLAGGSTRQIGFGVTTVKFMDRGSQRDDGARLPGMV